MPKEVPVGRGGYSDSGATLQVVVVARGFRGALEGRRGGGGNSQLRLLLAR